MPLLLVENACLAFGHWPLLDHATISVEPGERVGLIGRNGQGKSSLLKAVAGQIRLDDGEIRIAQDARMAFVAQEPEFRPDATVFEAVAEGLGNLSQILSDYHAVAMQQDGSQEALDKLMALQHEVELRDGWRFDALIAATLTQLNLPADTRIADLSGGWKKRVALARALVLEPQLLLLDEPTNHLDVSAIEWLENLLNNFAGSVLFITHDRRFLDNVATRIVELDRGTVTSFPGNFTTYETRKADLLAQEEVVNKKFDKVLAQEEVWIRKGVEARRTRNEGRVRRLEQLRRDRSARRERVGNVSFTLDAGERTGKLVAEFEHVRKAFTDPAGNEKVLVNDFTSRILRGDRIGLIGPNGAGKTTFLKLVLGELAPDAGIVKTGTNLQVAYFDQFRTQLDEEASIVDVIGQGKDYVEIGGARKHVMGYLEEFLFAPERARSPVKSLSGGERNRLLLAMLFTKPANVLVLDEPTNDLDIDTLELLESLLADYPGTLFLVSHDRAFLDNVVTQTIAFEGGGKLIENAGGYQDWITAKARMAAAAVPVESKTAEAAKPAADRNKARNGKLSFNDQRELEQLPAQIAALEAEQADLQQALLDPDLYKQAPAKAGEMQARIEAIDTALLEKLERWEVLEAKRP
ncbi:ABC transporter ATP-binding protein uup [Andreprevotia sp. IGB-42]|uniref:ATP-binding cassette domain-containing protein n=1 Tax=Andreprevotia sp. IGB-42 TaxID=2497473 RepID=UPI001359B53A|nr:ATP-binding cassette domain-containing protein [Andreprevotia sp. IGB-42]KAF0814973.1 ABC transporter ATP-binding protein uup [Andreprevotia sp. IGB-42]